MRFTKLSILTLFLSSILASTTLSAQNHKPLFNGKGNIIISSDGNEHDWDDWAASAMSLAILSSQKLQDKLILYTYSDHVWGSNQERSNVKGLSAYEHMRESVLTGGKLFGFTKTKFVCAVDNAEVAYNAMRDAINNSTSEEPLFIIAGGPMQVIGEGINRADADKRKNVTVISHSGWNNRHANSPQTAQFWWDLHSGWTFDMLIDKFGENSDGAKFIKIKDQNHGGSKYTALQCPRENFDWLKKSKARKCSYYKKGSWSWLYSRLESCAMKNETYFDISDAGILVYLLSGNENVSPDMIRVLMESPFLKK